MDPVRDKRPIDADAEGGGSLYTVNNLFFSVSAVVVLLEAAFQLSNGSLFPGLGPLSKLLIVLNSIAALALGPAMAVLVVRAAALAFRGGREKLYRGVARTSVLISVFLLSLTFYVHLDSFFYSSLKKNITAIPQPLNLVVFLLIAAFSIYVLIKAGGGFHMRFRRHGRKAVIAQAFLFALLLATYFYRTSSLPLPLVKDLQAAPSGRTLPNIIIFSPDALSTSHMSAYGYSRKTTPNIDALAGRGTVYTAAYANCSHSRCSDISVLTGKSPLETKVLFAPDILYGKNSFEHLPGILAQAGYRTVYLGDPYDALPRAYNMQRGFQVQNGFDTAFDPAGGGLSGLRSGLDLESYFLERLFRRYKERIGYALGVSNALLYSIALQRDVDSRMYFTDEESIEYLIGQVEGSKAPLFVYFHNHNTHPAFLKLDGRLEFVAKMRVFSNGKSQEGDTMDDFYDDAILSMDYLFGMLVESLERSGKMENTIIVFKTDHGINYDIDNPVPLIIYLPGREGGQVAGSGVQYMDIAPSLLSFVGLPVPAWMEGRDIFGGNGGTGQVEGEMFGVQVDEFPNERKGIGDALFGADKKYGIKHVFMQKGGFRFYLDPAAGVGNLYEASPGGFRRYLGNPGLYMEYRERVIRRLEESGADLSEASKKQ